MRSAVGTSLILLAITATMLTACDDKHHDDDDSAKVDVPITSDSTEAAAREELFVRINASFQTIKPILVHCCYDCHSNQTQFPWYYKIPGPKQLIDYDIKEACKHVNCSNDFPFGGHGKLGETLKAIRDEISDGSMPPITYRMLHWGRLIEGEQKDSVIQWIDSTLVLLGGKTVDSTEKLRSNLDWYP